jgi:hypothetical protein
VANTLNLSRQGAVGFIDWLVDRSVQSLVKEVMRFGNHFKASTTLELRICVCKPSGANELVRQLIEPTCERRSKATTGIEK